MSVDGERWQQIQNIYYAALEREPGKRSAFLSEACAGDTLLRQEVDSLLESHDEAGNFLSSPALDVVAKALAEQQSRSVAADRIGAYRIISLLGRGGMGEVYLAEDARLGRKVALKLLDLDLITNGQLRARFLREAQLASALDHPNICAVHEVGESAGKLFIAMQFVEGETLKQVIGARALGLDSLLSIAFQVADTLATAHERGIVHRDIKSSNVIITPRGQAKVLDFGLAKLVENPGEQDELTRTGAVMGTPAYMSPEQARGERADYRSDIFSFGAVMYEMATGRVPFKGKSQAETMNAVINEPHTPAGQLNKEVPPELSAMIDRALAKAPADRYQSVKEMLNDLRQVVAQTDSLARLFNSSLPLVPPRRHRLPARLFRLLEGRAVAATLAAILLAVVTAGFAYWLYTQSGPRVASTQSKLATPFQTMQMARLTSIGKVAGAAISPDGRYVVYVVDDAGMQSLWLRQSAATSGVQIVGPVEGQAYRSLTFSGDGNYIYYLRSERSDPRATLYQMAVLGGEPKKLIADVSIQDCQSNISFSPDGKQLALIRLDEVFKRTLVIINADGTAERALATRTLPEHLAGVAWSPDGKIIASLVGNYSGSGGLGGSKNFVEVRVEDGAEKPISQQRWGPVRSFAWLADSSGLIISGIKEAGLPQLWRISYPGGKAERITNDLNGYTGVSLTADSKALVTVQGEQPSNIWIAPGVDTGRAKKITPASGDYDELSWTPDDKIVYQSVVSGNSDIWIMNADGTGQKQLTADAGQNTFPSVSPDGRYIVFDSDRAGQIGIWRMDSDGSNPVQLVTGGSVAHCSPAGKWVIYYKHDAGEVHLWKVPIDGGDPVQLTFKNITARPAVSPDGRLIACNYLVQQPNSQFRIAVFPFEGGEPIKVFDIPTFPPREIHWTPDSRAVAYVETRKGVSNVWIQPIEGGKPVQLTDLKSDLIASFGWSRDGKRLAFTRRLVTSDAVLISDLK
jgi:eukaryotic-like serine/threonine-protein kinase